MSCALNVYEKVFMIENNRNVTNDNEKKAEIKNAKTISPFTCPTTPTIGNICKDTLW